MLCYSITYYNSLSLSLFLNTYIYIYIYLCIYIYVCIYRERGILLRPRWLRGHRLGGAGLRLSQAHNSANLSTVAPLPASALRPTRTVGAKGARATRKFIRQLSARSTNSTKHLQKLDARAVKTQPRARANKRERTVRRAGRAEAAER